MSTCKVSKPNSYLEYVPRETYQEIYESLEGDGTIFLKQLIVDDIKVLVLCRKPSKQFREG